MSTTQKCVPGYENTVYNYICIYVQNKAKENSRQSCVKHYSQYLIMTSVFALTIRVTCVHIACTQSATIMIIVTCNSMMCTDLKRSLLMPNGVFVDVGHHAMNRMDTTI